MTDVSDTDEAATPPDADRRARLAAARESFSGRTLTESQFQEAWAIAGIIHGEIQRSGSFRDKLTDYAHPYARAQKFDALRGEKILRDIYAARYQQTMNQTRTRLMSQEENLPDRALDRVLICAETIGELIQKAPTQPFYQAYDRAAVSLAGEMRITQVGAKRLMNDVYQSAYGCDLYEAGKELERTFYRPARDAELAERKADQQQSRAQSRS